MGTATFGVDVGVVDDVVEAGDDVVDEVVVVVVDVVAKPGVIVNPQPCDGSFSTSGFETGELDGVLPNGGEVVVVVFTSVVVLDSPVVDVVVVDDEVVVGEESGVFLVIFSIVPVSTSAMSTTERATRSGQRRWGKAFGELRISRSR
jgi:hypothetical protein